MRDAGPMSHPIRHPVAANDSVVIHEENKTNGKIWDAEFFCEKVPRSTENVRQPSVCRHLLPADPTVIVLSHMPGSVAILWCFLSS